MHLKHIFLILLGFIGIWLLLWDFIDYLTMGLNTGIWDWAIIQNGFPSIFVGFIIICIVGVYGVKVFK